MGGGAGAAKQLHKAKTDGLVKGAVEQKVGHILCGGSAVGAVGRGAVGSSEGSSGDAVASSCAGGAVPVTSRWVCKWGVKTLAMPGRIT